MNSHSAKVSEYICILIGEEIGETSTPHTDPSLPVMFPVLAEAELGHLHPHINFMVH
jgi:hypothetical protein